MAVREMKEGGGGGLAGSPLAKCALQMNGVSDELCLLRLEGHSDHETLRWEPEDSSV